MSRSLQLPRAFLNFLSCDSEYFLSVPDIGSSLLIVRIISVSFGKKNQWGHLQFQSTIVLPVSTCWSYLRPHTGELFDGFVYNPIAPAADLQDHERVERCDLPIATGISVRPRVAGIARG